MEQNPDTVEPGYKEVPRAQVPWHFVCALDSGSSGLGSSAGRGHCVVFLGTQVYEMGIGDKMLWGNLASHPGRVAMLLVGFLLQKPE